MIFIEKLSLKTELNKVEIGFIYIIHCQMTSKLI